MKETSSFTLTTCWIYVIVEELFHRQSVGFTINPKSQLQKSESPFILYYRRFDNIQDGIAHKLLLEHLSADSVDTIISKMNPTRENLHEKLIKEAE